MTVLEEMTLETLSFYKPMTIESLVLSLDREIIDSMPGLDMSDLKDILTKLKKEKKVVLIKKNSKIYYQRKMPSRGLLRWVSSFFKV
ncbi:MAG: hypothetical protein KAG61_10300 [Bacteriovoracaceae bacterium]|nr:hypothetical protein [Bacteriovoracaceae bacterium]